LGAPALFGVARLLMSDYTPLYTTLTTVKRLVRSEKFNLTIAPTSPVTGETYNFSEHDALEFIRDAEEEVTVAASARYTTPLTPPAGGLAAIVLARAAARLTVFYLYQAAYPTVQPNEFPATIKTWADAANETLKGLIKGTVGLAGCEQSSAPVPLLGGLDWPHEIAEGDELPEGEGASVPHVEDGDILDGTGS
jgi:hypothetical protein